MKSQFITPIFTFSGSDINALHKNACLSIFEHGNDIEFGDPSERKLAREIDGTIQIYGKGLKDTIRGKTPRGFLWSGDKIKVLQEQFVDENLNPHGFDYTYPEQLRAYSKGLERRYDQLEILRKGLAEDVEHDIFNNRRVAVLYHPSLADEKEVPCFNWLQLRYQGQGQVSARYLFRSHDWGTADWANFASINYCFDELVLKPLGLQMSEMICHSTSGHIYNNDSQEIEKLLGKKFQRYIPGWWNKK